MKFRFASINKVSPGRAHLLRVHDGCLHALRAELSSCSKESLSIYYLALCRKCLLTPV